MPNLQLNPRPIDPRRKCPDFASPARARALCSLSAFGALMALCACGSMDLNNEGGGAYYVGGDNYYEAPVAAPIADQEPPPSSDEAPAMSTNPFVMTAHDPLSTFATDVDTASYDYFARVVGDGALPDRSTVRLEDFVNYFEYQYPTLAPDAELPFSIDLAAALHPLGGELRVLRVALQGKAAPAQEKKATNLTFLVDVSGSMLSSDKLPLVQQVLRQTLDLLEPEDTVSIVSYASDTRVRLEPTPARDRARIASEINRLSAGGSTAGASGIQLAYAQASAAFIEGGINHVVLCTDGDFNVGPSSTRELVDLIVQKRRSGIPLTALGFGTDNLNDGMMEAVSNAGNGYYGFIGSEESAAKYVRERMLATLTLIAKDVKVQVEFNPEFVRAYRLLGYENRAIADDDFRDDIVDAGEVGAGHRVTALYEVVRAGASMPEVTGAPAVSDGEPYQGAVEVAPEELVRVKLRYKAVDATETDPALEVVSSLPPAALSEPGVADLDLEWAAGMAAFAEILEDSPYARPDRVDALDRLFEAQAGRDANRQEFYGLFQDAMF